MSAEKTMRLSQVARKLNVGTSTIVDHLAEKGIEIENKPNTKIDKEQIDLLTRAFQKSVMDKEEASEVSIGTTHYQNFVLDSQKKGNTESKKEVKKQEKVEKVKVEKIQLQGIKVVGKVDIEGGKKTSSKVLKKEDVKKEEVKKKEPIVAEKIEPKEIKPVEKPTKTENSTPLENKEKTNTPPLKKEKPVEKIEKATPIAKKEVVEKEKVPTPAKALEIKPVVVNKVEKTPDNNKEEKKPSPKTDVKSEEPKTELIEAKSEKLQGLKVLGKIELPKEQSSNSGGKKKRKRVRLEKKPVDVKKPVKGNDNKSKGGGNHRGQGQRRGNAGKKNFKKEEKQEISQQEIQDKIKATMAKLGGGGGSSNQRSKYRKEKRSAVAEADEQKRLQEMEEAKVLRVTEFISANDLASLMSVSVNEIISMCMTLGMFVSINQRLDAETITLITEEFGYTVSFTTSEEEEEEEEEKDDPADLKERAPVVTIMGHVDHGKTSLLDYIRSSKVASGEAGGITQHIGAYNVTTDSGKAVSFLDTPGHEAFTAMRARGAKLTDIVVLVVAADDRVMPQTKEAINHAKMAEVPIIIALNKIDKPSANPDKIREELSKEDILVEEWGGKYQCQEVSAKTGIGIDDLLEKILLEAEIMDLKANPDKMAAGTIVEASLDKGRGYLSTMLVQGGTLNVGDIVVSGGYYGRVKAMTDHLGKRLKTAGPSMPIQMLGLDGAPQAGDKFKVVETDREAKEIATKRSQLLREQQVRTKKHLTLDEIGRRLAIGNFKELNLIIKGDVDGSVEALTDSLLKLSTEEVAVNIIHKAVGQITESDVLLATASDAIIIGFQVRPSQEARKLAENEDIEIRMYSVIYKAIEEMKDALEGMLDPEVEEVVTGNIEIREVFKISKVGTVAGCYVLEGNVNRKNQIRIIREGVVVHTGAIDALKRFKDDVSEVKFGYECGLSVKNYNDIQVGDVIESFEEREVKRKLK